MVGVLAGVAGLVVGLFVSWLVLNKRVEVVRDAAASARSDLAVRDSQLASANELLERQKLDHDAAIANMELSLIHI